MMDQQQAAATASSTTTTTTHLLQQRQQQQQHQQQHHHREQHQQHSLHQRHRLRPPSGYIQQQQQQQQHSRAIAHYHEPALASLAYGPLQLPLLQQTTQCSRPIELDPQQQQRQHQQSQQNQQNQPALLQLPVAAASTAPYQQPNPIPIPIPIPIPSFRQYHHHHHHQHQQHHPLHHHHHPSLLSHRTRPALRLTHHTTPLASQRSQPQCPAPLCAMADYDGHHPTEDEQAEHQRLSEQYQPEIHGPLVGQRQPSTAISSEYSSADPTYQAKTAALPQKYSHYRTVRGDGNCGWRAVAFGYFEALISYGDSTRFSLEEARLTSLDNVMANAGFDPMLFEDFTQATCDLLRQIRSALAVGNAEDVLLEQFNDDMLQNYVITHLRTLTAAWMKSHEENYAPWLLGQTIHQYCETSILPVAAEIDHVGLVALKDALLSPAGLSLEVMYLDRSEGNEVTMHRFDPASPGSYPVGFVRLLYRPGHYDILYKQEDLPALVTAVPPPSATVPTYLQFGSHSHQPVYEIGGADFMTTIPGMSFANLDGTSWMSSPSYGTDTEFFAPAPVQACTQALPTPPVSASEPQGQPQPVFIPNGTTSQLIPPPTQMPQQLTIRTSLPQATIHHTELEHQLSGGPFRPSAWQLEPDFLHATSQMPFQTSIFRNSHFNTAHFLNPEFQPEQWDPEDEYATISSSNSSNKSMRHKCSG